ncbi:phytohormone-binding protein-like [Coffea eugenioides]|uniref:phytohormone-binding protein-like n=1 Tax=Coffea eugenioides TaxID=49369 RepID=UPI000F6071DA|nr:phytohormone-binding protein-like [Coffea eugenioides]
MMKEVKSQMKVGVAIEVLWRKYAKEISFVLPKLAPNLVRSIEVIEGDGGLGTVYLINLGSEKSSLGYQKEKVTVFNESLHQIGMQVIEGGHLNHGFTSYTTVIQFNAVGESETGVDVKVLYETEAEETRMPEETAKAILAFIKRLEDYLLKQGS